MKIADSQIKKLMKFALENNYSLCIATSMGQASIDRGEYIPELFINRFNSISRALGLEENCYEILPAMQPDLCIKCENHFALNQLRKNIEKLKSDNNEILVERYNPVGLFLNLSIQNSKNCALEKKIRIKDKIFKLSELEIDLIKRDQGTGYHIPEGSLLLYGDLANEFKYLNNQLIDSRQVAPLFLKYFGLDKPDYMLDI